MRLNIHHANIKKLDNANMTKGERSKMKKMLYLLIGSFGLVIGGIAAFVPLLPSFPFLLIATLCFGRSSKRVYRWFVRSKLYRENLESFLQKKGMTMSAKRNLIMTVSITMAIGFVMMKGMWLGQIILAIVWGCHIVYFIYGVETVDHKKQMPVSGSQ